MKIGDIRLSLWKKTLCLGVFVVLFCSGIARAQTNELSVPDDLSVLETSDVTPAPDVTSTPSAGEASTLSLEGSALAAPGQFRRTVVLMLGGVSWQEWLKLTGPATPGFRRVLEEGALAAVRLPGAAENGGAGEYSSSLSPALLRAAGVLSSGQVPRLPLPLETAVTLGTDEAWNPRVPGWEDATPAVAYARRTARKPAAEELLNLGWGALRRQETLAAGENYGALGSAVRAVGARSFAFGSADTGVDAARVELLREWALAVATREGAVDGGDLSAALLREDVSAPFNVRTDADALLAAVDTALSDARTALVSVEWGDTRRAALYAPLAASSAAGESRVDVAAALRLDALTGADAWLQKLLLQLSNSNDRLLVLAVPDLQTARAQWLPCAWWRPQRTGRGALLRVVNGALQPGLVPMEDLTSLLVSRLPPAPASDAAMQTLRTAAFFDESGQPTAASARVGRLLALQSGVAWLDAARHRAQAIWALLLTAAVALSLVALAARRAPVAPSVLEVPVADAAVRRTLATRRQRRLVRFARKLWIAAMVLPPAFWLVGLCLEVMRRLGAGAGGESGWSWTAPLALGAVALAIVAVVGAMGAWFQKRHLNRTRVGLSWLALTLIGLWIGGFALPWNSLLGASLLDAGGWPPLIGENWALWLISATLLSVAGLTRARSQMVDDEANARRIINLRPAALWMLGVAALLLWSDWNREGSAALVALVALGVMWLRLWLERAEYSTRANWRRGVLGAVAVFIVLLSLQRGGWVAVQSTLSLWWPDWLQSWQFWWWNLALLATAVAALAAATLSRPVLRAYFATRYSSRAMLTAALLGSVAALFLIGPSGPALLALYTLGAVFYEVLGE